MILFPNSSLVSWLRENVLRSRMLCSTFRMRARAVINTTLRTAVWERTPDRPSEPVNREADAATEINGVKLSIRRKRKTYIDAVQCAGLAVLLTSVNSPGRAAADGADTSIAWLPLTQASPPSKIADLRKGILTFLEPLRRKLFGDPDAVFATAYFISISSAGARQNALPSATSTNSDGTLACVLSAAQFSPYHQRIQTIEGVEQFAAPRVISLERMRATLSVSRMIRIGGTNAAYGQSVDLVHYINGTNLQMRVIADVTQAVTNVVPANVSAPASESVSIRTLFQSALDARVSSGGCVAVWNKPAGGVEKSYLLLISPVIQTNSLLPVPGAPPGAAPGAK